MSDGWLVGRKEICAYLHCTWQTVRRWNKEYGLPLRHRPGGKPFAIPAELNQWADVLEEKRRKRARGGKAQGQEDGEDLMEKEAEME